MTPQEFTRRWNERKTKLLAFVKRPAHTIMGSEAVKWFNANYTKEQWFTGSGWSRWKKPKRYDPRGGTIAQYGTLMSKRTHLFRSTHPIPFDDRVLIVNKVPYAKIHNEGGDIDQNITITPKMRKWAWYMYYKNGGGNKKGGSLKGKSGRSQMQILMSGTRSNPIADKYKALALTKKTVIHRTIKMPKRPFIYNNAELAKVLRNRLTSDVRRILLS